MIWRRSGLLALDEKSPHHFEVTLAVGADIERVDAALTERLARELDYEIRRDERVIECRSTFTPRSAAIFRPLHALQRAEVGVARLEMLDGITDARPDDLDAVVRGWREHANRGPHRRRVEAIAGIDALRLLLSRMDEAEPRLRSAYRFAVGCASFNTSGSESTVLARAVETRDWNEASDFVQMATERARLARLSGSAVEVNDDLLIPLIGRTDFAGESTAVLLQFLPGELSPALTDALCRAAERAKGEHVARLIHAFMRAAPTDTVRDALEDALENGETAARAAALESFAALWGEEARPWWRAMLAGRSAPLRHTAEFVLGRHGAAEDLEDAATHLGKVIRAKPGSVSWSPPRGSELIELLVRHRGEPEADRGLDDVSARWDRLPDELRAWVAAHHGWLDPAGRTDEPTETDAQPEESLRWPLPAIEVRDDGTHHLWFEQTDMFDTADLFARLAAEHEGVEVVDGDREWMSLRIDHPRPEEVIRDLWERAGGDPTA